MVELVKEKRKKKKNRTHSGQTSNASNFLIERIPVNAFSSRVRAHTFVASQNTHFIKMHFYSRQQPTDSVRFVIATIVAAQCSVKFHGTKQHERAFWFDFDHKCIRNER